MGSVVNYISDSDHYTINTATRELVGPLLLLCCSVHDLSRHQGLTSCMCLLEAVRRMLWRTCDTRNGIISSPVAFKPPWMACRKLFSSKVREEAIEEERSNRRRGKTKVTGFKKEESKVKKKCTNAQRSVGFRCVQFSSAQADTIYIDCPPFANDSR